MSALDKAELAIRQKLKDDFIHYASKCLHLRTKAGEIVPFVLNEAQLYIHSQIEKQRAETGKVRAIILKGRQQGCSTYVEGRLYWRDTHGRGLRAFILTHSDDATNNIFEIAQRFHENCPPMVRPVTKAANAKELNFGDLDSGYKVGTAGSKAAGRGSTIQLFHGSECGFWPNAQEHAAGILQAIPDEPGTEIFLESTANGVGNYFHKLWQSAEAGESEFVAIFVPWYWTAEYRIEAGEDFIPTEEENDYQAAYGLDLEQIAWRRKKITELGDPTLFKQEYPATAAEAFQVTGADPFIAPEIVMKARKAKGVTAYGPTVLGVDPARFGDDRTAICCRQGRLVHWIRTFSKLDAMQVVGRVIKAIEEMNPDRVFIDTIGLGAGVYDRLMELYPKELIVAVAGSNTAMNEQRYFNRRSELWGNLKEWLTSPAQVSIPDSDELHADVTQIKYGYDSNGRLKMERKEDMKKRGIRSTDMADAIAYTLALPVKPKPKEEKIIDFEPYDDEFGY